MLPDSRLCARPIRLASAFFLALGLLLLGVSPLRAQEKYVRLNHSFPTAVANAQHLGRLDPTKSVRLAVTLPLRNQQELHDLLGNLYDPTHFEYHHFLTPDEFTARFGPSQADYDAVAAYFQAKGLKVVGTSPNRAVLDVEGPSATVESALSVQFHHYQAPNGRLFYAANAAPALPASIAARIGGVIGMDNAKEFHPQVVRKQGGPGAVASIIGTGPLGGLAPKDIKKAYTLDILNIPNGSTPDGTGQTQGLLELDGYSAATIQTYENFFGLPHTTLVNVNVDGGHPGIGGGEIEVALDIELMVAIAPKSTIYVYLAPNTFAAVIDTYHKIATDNKAASVSTSWGLWESDFSDGGATFRAEASAFQQMAAQGQSMFAASGDYGSGDPNLFVKSVLDPASQPYVTGVGGTTLSVVNPGVDETYNGETAWIGSGGGISSFWAQPAYQGQVHPFFNGGADFQRNVPDVALNADPNTGYDIYSQAAGGWATVGGTSAAAPLWAAYFALVNQGRAKFSLGNVGFANPALYGIYTKTLTQYPNSSLDFHDITVGHNNDLGIGGFNAGTGYDDVTGLGSYLGEQLFYQLVQVPKQLAPPLPPTNVTATPGDKTALVAWTASGGASKYLVYATSGGAVHLASVSTTTSSKVTGLTNGTLYTFYVIAQNSGGASDYSASASTIPAQVSITGGPSAAPASGKATITWTTNVLSDSRVAWGTSSASLTHTVSSTTQHLSHSITITGLPTTHGTTIFYKVASKDDAAVIVTSSVHSFLTP